MKYENLAKALLGNEKYSSEQYKENLKGKTAPNSILSGTNPAALFPNISPPISKNLAAAAAVKTEAQSQPEQSKEELVKQRQFESTPKRTSPVIVSREELIATKVTPEIGSDNFLVKNLFKSATSPSLVDGQLQAFKHCLTGKCQIYYPLYAKRLFFFFLKTLNMKLYEIHYR